MNLDCYFNYLKDYMPNLKLGVFVPKNLLFLHYNQLWSFKMGAASFMQYKENKIEYPLISKFYNTNEIGIGYVPRNKKTVFIDINIGENDGINWLKDNLVPKENHEYWLKIMNKKI